MEHPMDERAGCLPSDPLRLWRRRDGIPTPLVTHHYPAPVLEGDPGAEDRRRRLLVVSLGICLLCQVMATRI
jgi:hypothetical protein